MGRSRILFNVFPAAWLAVALIALHMACGTSDPDPLDDSKMIEVDTLPADRTAVSPPDTITP